MSELVPEIFNENANAKLIVQEIHPFLESYYDKAMASGGLVSLPEFEKDSAVNALLSSLKEKYPSSDPNKSVSMVVAQYFKFVVERWNKEDARITRG